MRRFGRRFVALGEIASIRFGVKTGCDAFFMPRDITADVLGQARERPRLPQTCRRRRRRDVESGKLRIIKAGDGTVHPIEAEYLAPEVHSLMKVDRPMIRAADVDRVVLLVAEPMEQAEGEIALGLALPPLRHDGDVRLQQVEARSRARSVPPARPAIRGTT